MKSNDVNYEIAKAIGNIDDKYIIKDYGIKKISKISKTILILVAIVSITTGWVYYSGLSSKSIDIYSDKLGNSAEQIQIIRQLGTPIGKSITNNGITLTVDSIIGDDTTAIVLYSFSNEDNNLYLPRINIGKYFFGRNEEGFIYSSGTDIIFSGSKGLEIIDIDTSDGIIEVIEYFNVRELPKGEIVTAIFNNIILRGENWSWENDVTELIYEGFWKIDYLFDYPDVSKILVQDESFSYNEKEINIEKLWITPFSINIELYIDRVDSNIYTIKDLTDEERESVLNGDEYIISKNFFLDSEFLDTIPFYYTTIDGDNIDTLYGFGGNFSSEDSYFYGSKQHRYEQITPFEKIVSVTFGDLTINVNDIETQISEYKHIKYESTIPEDLKEETEFVGVLKSEEPIVLGDYDYSDLESISIFLDCVEEVTYDFDDFLDNYITVQGFFEKGELAFDEFLEIYSNYTLNPLEYSNQDATGFNDIENLMRTDLDFLFANKFEAPISKIEIALFKENREISKIITLHSNGIITSFDSVTGEYLPYTMSEKGIEFKEDLYKLLENYPNSFNN